MDYTNNDKEIVFLNDRNIVHELSGGTLPDYNAIPSLSLLQSCFIDLCAHSDALCAAVSAQVDRNRADDKNELSNSLSNHSNYLCSLLCTEIDKSFLKKVGGVIDGSLSVISSLAVGKGASASTQNGVAFGRDAHANDHDSFVWNGNDKDDSSENQYASNGAHTFNLNPANGLCGIYVGDKTLCSIISEDIKLSANAITSDVCATYAKISDVYELAEIDNISAQLCSAVSSQHYVKKGDVKFEYADHNLVLSVAPDNVLSISTNRFEVGRFIQNVKLSTNLSTNITYIDIEFKLAAPDTTEHIYIPINELVQLYTNGNGITISPGPTDTDAHYYTIAIDDTLVAFKTDLTDINDYIAALKGTPTSTGIIGTLSSDVDVLKIQNTRELKFDNIIAIEASQLTGDTTKLSLSALIAKSLGKDTDQVRNGSIFLVQYADDANTSLSYTTIDGIQLGNNDFIIVRTLKKDQSYVELSTLSIKEENCNVYITNAVHRYEYENLSSDLSNAIVSTNTKINKKIYIDGVSAETLCAEHIDADTFHQKVVDGKLLSNVMYVVSSDYINAYDQRIENVKDPEEKQDAATKNYVDTVSANLSDIMHDEVSAVSSVLSNALTAEISNRIESDNKFTADIAALSGAVDSKIYTGSYDGEKYNITSANLSVVKIDADDYYKMVADKTVDDKVVYILSSSYLNAYDQLVKNVKTPENETDATNKKYVDGISTEISNAFAAADKKLDDKITTKSNKISVDGTGIDALSITHIKNEDFYKLVADGELETSVMYIVSGDYVNAYDRQIKYALDPTDDQDAATKHYVDTNAASTVEIIKSVSSSIDTAVKDKVWVGGFYQTTSDVSATYHQDATIENLSVVNIGAEDYYKLVATDTENKNVVYIVSSDTINAYDQRIENVATPAVDTDAANKKYVDEHGANILKANMLKDPFLSTYISKKEPITEIGDMTLSALHRIAIGIFNAIITA